MKIFQLLASQSERRPWLVVGVVVLLTLFLAAGLPRISTELSQEAMMPKHYESIQAYEELKDLVGGVSNENVLVLADLADPEVARIIYGWSVESLREEGFAEGSITKVETYLDFLKIQLPQLIRSAGMRGDMALSDFSGVEDSFFFRLIRSAAMPGGIDLGDIPDEELSPFLRFYLDPNPSSAMPLPENTPLGDDAALEVGAMLMGSFEKNRENMAKAVSADNRATLVKLQLNPELSQNDKVALGKKIREFVSAEFAGMQGTEAYVTGEATSSLDANEFMGRETSRLMLIALAFIMLILYLTFRRISDVGLPLLIIFIAIFWLLGLMGWVGITYTTMSVAIMPLMLGINIAYVIHILSRYYEGREGGLGVELSGTTAIKTVGVAVFLTAITTVIGFSSFMITDIPPMRDFGLLCMLGISFSFLLSLTLLPAIIIIRDRRKTKEKLDRHLTKMRTRRRDARYGRFTDRSLVRVAMVSERNHWTVAIVALAFAAFTVFAIFNLKTGADISKMFPDDMESVKVSHMVSEIFGPQQSDIILARGDIFDPATLAALLELEEAIPQDERNLPDHDDYFVRERISSIADYIGMLNGGPLPETTEGVRERVEELSSLMPINAFMDEDGSIAMIYLNSGFPASEDELTVKAEIMRDHSAAVAEETGLTFTSTGFTVLISDLMGNIMPTQIKTSGLALLLCALILILVFRSFLYGIATLVVVLCGMMAEIVFLFVLGWPLDLMTVMVASLVIGAGIDFGIHITHRFREEYHANGITLEESLRNTVKNVGRALVAAAFTTCGVFAILGFSSMGMMQRFGWATAVGLLGALLGAILVLPSVLAIVAKRHRGSGRAAAGERPGREGQALPGAADTPQP